MKQNCLCTTASGGDIIIDMAHGKYGPHAQKLTLYCTESNDYFTIQFKISKNK